MEPQDFTPAPAGAPQPDVAGDHAAAQDVDAPAPVAAAAAAAGAPQPDVAGDHTIEHRSFGRADAITPMPVTVITTRDSLIHGA